MSNNFKHTRTVSDAIKVKGTVNIDNDGAYITYEKDKEEYTVSVNDLFAMYSGETINFLLTTKEETDLDE